ncbi:MAG: hypothetical protein ABF449_02405 [Ethanoligenens sp.]
MNIVLIVAIAAGAAAAASYLTVFLQKKGINGEAILEDVEKGLGYGESLASAIAPFVPELPLATVNVVLTSAQKAVQSVEATYKAQLAVNAGSPDTRKSTATSLIQSALALDGITVDAKTNKLISVAIEALVLALPKTHAVK